MSSLWSFRKADRASAAVEDFLCCEGTQVLYKQCRLPACLRDCVPGVVLGSCVWQRTGGHHSFLRNLVGDDRPQSVERAGGGDSGLAVLQRMK